jgi:hypothetical protein
MSFTRPFMLGAAIGWYLMAVGTGMGSDEPPTVDDAVIKAFVAYLAENDIKLDKDKSEPRNPNSKGGYEGGRWVVTDPKDDGYEVDVYFKTFPPGTSDMDMRAALAPIALAGTVNAPARLAMSHPGLRAADRAKLPGKPDDVPVAAKLKKLFKEYQPPKPKD